MTEAAVSLVLQIACTGMSGASNQETLAAMIPASESSCVAPKKQRMRAAQGGGKKVWKGEDLGSCIKL